MLNQIKGTSTIREKKITQLQIKVTCYNLFRCVLVCYEINLFLHIKRPQLIGHTSFSSANKKCKKSIFNVLNSIPSNERTQAFNELKKTGKQKISKTNVKPGGGGGGGGMQYWKVYFCVVVDEK